ncbi:MAG: hypothetical protein IT430_07460 [Phycisphaerales bacterium]|nr:hypothetical protein [Phycisphaerales bacterium]
MKWLAIAFAAVVVLILAALWQLPWLLGTSAGRSFVASKISSPAAQISIDALDLTWSGNQSISGLQVRDAQGREIADVSASFKGSLWSWAQGSRDFGTVALSGDVTVYESPAKRDSPPGPKPGRDSKPAPTGKAEDLSDIIIPEGVKAAVELDQVNVKYVPLPGSAQPAMAVRDVQGRFAIDGRSPMTVNLAGATEVGASEGSFHIDASLSDFAAADGSLQVDQARINVDLRGENLPVPIIEQMLGERGRLSAAIGESASVSVIASGGMNGGEATLKFDAPRAKAELVATVDAQRRLNVTTGTAQLRAEQQTLEALVGIDALSGLTLSQRATANLHIQTLTVQLPTGEAPLDLSTARVDATLAIDAASFETGREDVKAAEVRNLAVRVTSVDPTQRVNLKGSAEVNSHLAASNDPVMAPLDVDVGLLHAFQPSGQWSAETLGVEGRVQTGGVPTSLIDSLAGADGWIVDALGPMVGGLEVAARQDRLRKDSTDLNFIATSTPGLGDAHALLRLEGGKVTTQAVGGSVTVAPILVSLTVRPALRDRLAALLAESAPEVELIEGGRVQVRLDSLELALPTESNPDSWKAAALRGSVVLDGARGIYAPPAAEGEAQAPKQYDIDHLAIDFRTESMSKSIAADIKTSLRQNGSALNLNAKGEVTNALDTAARTIAFETVDVPVALDIITAWAGERQDVVTETLGGPVRVSVNGLVHAAGLSANASVRGERTNAELTYAVQNEQPLFELRGTQRATPALVAALLGPEPVAALAEPADLTFALSTPGAAPAGAEFNTWPLKLDASSPRAVLTGIAKVPGTITAVDAKLNGDWAAGLDGVGRYALTGQVSDGQSPIAGVTSELRYTIGGDWTRSRGRVTVSDINVTGLERTLALDTGLLTSWLGRRGNLELGSVVNEQGELTDDVRVSAQFDQASASIAGRITEDRLVVNTPGTVTAHLNRARLTSLLNEWAGGAGESPVTWTALEDSDFSATVRSVSLPLAALSGGVYDPSQLAIDADVRVPRLALRQGETDLSLSDTLLTIGGTNLAEGIIAQLRSATQMGSAPARGIELTSSVRAASSTAEDRRYGLRGEMKSAPVAIIDALARMNGKLVAALGPAMDLRLDLADAHAGGGTLAASFTTPNGTLAIPKADLRDNTLVIEAANPVSASLEVTPEMSSTLLTNVNPLLYDVRKKAGPIAFNAPRLVLPLDGDVSKLDGQFTLDLGQLYVPTKGILGEFLGQLKPKTDQSEPDRVETTIPPITGRITKGVLEYDQFIMQSQAFEITTSGKVDLVNRKLDLLASVPLIGWKSVFADMTKIAPAFLTDIPLNVPFYLVVRGPIDKPEIKPDPKGAKRVADEFFKNIGGNLIDNVIDDLFKPKK